MSGEVQDLVITCATPVPRDSEKPKETFSAFLDRVREGFPDRSTDDQIDDNWLEAERWEPDDLDSVWETIADRCEENKYYVHTFPEGVIAGLHVRTIDDPRFPYVFANLDCVVDPEEVVQKDDPGETIHHLRFALQAYLDYLAGRNEESNEIVAARCPAVTFAASQVPEGTIEKIKTLIERRNEKARKDEWTMPDADEERQSINDLAPVSLQFRGRGSPRSLLHERYGTRITLLGDAEGGHYAGVRNPAIHVLYEDSGGPSVYRYMQYPQPNPGQLDNGNFRWMTSMLAVGAWMESENESVADLEKCAQQRLQEITRSKWNYLNPFWLVKMYRVSLDLTSKINHVEFFQRRFGETLSSWADGNYDGIEETPIQSPSRFGFSAPREEGYLARFAVRFQENLDDLSSELEEMHSGALSTLDQASTAVRMVFTTILVALTVVLVYLTWLLFSSQ